MREVIEEPSSVSLPDIRLRRIAPKMKAIWIDGEKAGDLHFDSNDRHVGLGEWRKSSDWSGEFRFDGTRFHVGPTDKVANLLPKITRLVRSHLIRKAADLNDAVSS